MPRSEYNISILGPGVVPKVIYRRRHALIVEDSLQFAEMLKSYIDAMSRMKSTVCQTSSEVEAALQKYILDMVIVDVCLNEESGIDICQMVRSRCPHAAIIVITANNDIETLKRCIAAGADDFVEKSSNLAKIFDRIRHWSFEKYPRMNSQRRRSIVTSIEKFAHQMGGPASVTIDSRTMDLLMDFVKATRSGIEKSAICSLRGRINLLGYVAGAVSNLQIDAHSGLDQGQEYMRHGFKALSQLPQTECEELLALLDDLSKSAHFKSGQEAGRLAMAKYREHAWPNDRISY